MKSFGKKDNEHLAESFEHLAQQAPEPEEHDDPAWIKDSVREIEEIMRERHEEHDDLAWIKDSVREIEEIMRERHSKYGPGNIAQFGDFGVMVRLSDKLARLQHSSGNEFADEATRDTWLDVIGYGLIGLAWVDGNWPGSEGNKKSWKP